MKENTSDYLALAKDLARRAGDYARDVKREELTIESKNNAFDLVTHVDKRNEEFIRTEVFANYPHHSFLGEEGGAADGAGEVKWIVDPIDGTINYAHGVPIWCVSIGVEVSGTLVCGAVYDASRNEMFTAIAGGGAFLNHTPIHVSEISTITKALLVTGFPSFINNNPGGAIEHFSEFLRRGILVRRLGSAALDLCYVAAGRFDAFFEVALAPWDMAAGVLIAREAGATITHYDGSEHSIYNKPIIASNGKIHSWIKEIVEK